MLYSNYERQVEDLLAGRIHAAWNSPLAWVRARRLADAAGTRRRALAMRDTDRDLTSVVVVRADCADRRRVDDLAGQGRRRRRGRLAAGHAAPAVAPARAGLEPGVDVDVRRFDVGVGLHGDHIGGERDAARALVAGEVDAACMIDGNHLLFASEGTLPRGLDAGPRPRPRPTTTAT